MADAVFFGSREKKQGPLFTQPLQETERMYYSSAQPRERSTARCHWESRWVR